MSPLANPSTPVASQLLASHSHAPAAQQAVAIAGSALADVDAANLAITFVVPASGSVIVSMSARIVITNFVAIWGLREGAADVPGSRRLMAYSSDIVGNRYVYRAKFTGLTPGAVKTWKLAHGSDGGGTSGSTQYGGTGLGDAGAALMEVWDAGVVPGAGTYPIRSLLASAQLRHATVDTTISTGSTASVDVDAALSCTFIVPPSGRVIVMESGFANVVSELYSGIFSVREGVADVANSAQMMINSAGAVGVVYRKLFTGLAPGAVLTWKWGWRLTAAGTCNLYHGPTYGSLLMEVHDGSLAA